MRAQLTRQQNGLAPRRTVSTRIPSSNFTPIAASGKGRQCTAHLDDAVYYDHGMRLGTLTFDENGNQTRTEATLKERENMRRYNWLVREAHPNTIKADLAAVWDQIGRWPLNREVERTIPQIQFANSTEIIKMPLCVRHLVAQEAVTLDELVQAREVTYGDWYQDRLATVTLEMAARGLYASFPALLTSFGLGWHLDVIAAEFCLTDDQLKDSLTCCSEPQSMRYWLLHWPWAPLNLWLVPLPFS